MVRPSSASAHSTSTFYSFLVQEYYYLSLTAASIFWKRQLAPGALLADHPFIALHLGCGLAFYLRSPSYALDCGAEWADAANHLGRLAIFSKIGEHS